MISVLSPRVATIISVEKGSCEMFPPSWLSGGAILALITESRVRVQRHGAQPDSANVAHLCKLHISWTVITHQVPSISSSSPCLDPVLFDLWDWDLIFKCQLTNIKHPANRLTH